MERKQFSEPWEKAEAIAPALIAHLRSSDSGQGWNWMAMLRSLNKSWHSQVTIHIKAVNVVDGQTAHLAESLHSSLAHLKSVSVKLVYTSNLYIDEDKGDLKEWVDESVLVAPIFKSRARITYLQIDFDHSGENAGVHEDVSDLGCLTSLTHLDASNANNLDILKACPSLVELSLSNCRLQRSDLEHLKELKQLRISSTQLFGFEPVGADDGSQTFPSLTSIVELQVSNHSLSISDIHGLQEMLKSLPNLAKLKCDSDPSIFSGLFGGAPSWPPQIMGSLPQSLKDLELREVVHYGENSLFELRSLTQLQRLSVGSGSRGHLDYKSFGWVGSLTSLTSLTLWGNSVDNLSFAWLRTLPKLNFLGLNISEWSVPAFVRLCWVHTLKEIHIGKEAVLNLVSSGASETEVTRAGAKFARKGVCLSSPIRPWQTPLLNIVAKASGE